MHPTAELFTEKAWAAVVAAQQQIGRASCRERVFQLV